MDTDLSAVTEEVAETDDSCRVDFIEIVPLTRDVDSSCTTECVSGGGCAEFREFDLADLKQEPDDVCCILCPVSVYYIRINYKFVKIFSCCNYLGDLGVTYTVRLWLVGKRAVKFYLNIVVMTGSSVSAAVPCSYLGFWDILEVGLGGQLVPCRRPCYPETRIRF